MTVTAYIHVSMKVNETISEHNLTQVERVIRESKFRNSCVSCYNVEKTNKTFEKVGVGFFKSGQ